MPEIGVTKRKFAEWSGKTAEVQCLIRFGWVQEDLTTSKVYMHAIVRDMIHDAMHPTILTCETVINSMIQDCRKIEEFSYYDEKEWWSTLREVNLCSEGVILYLREDTVLCALYFTLITIYSYVIGHLSWKHSFFDGGFGEAPFDRISMEYIMHTDLQPLLNQYPEYRRILDEIKPICQKSGEELATLWALANEKLEAGRKLYDRLGKRIQLEKKVASPMLKKRITPQRKHSKGKQRGGHREKHHSLSLYERLSGEQFLFQRKIKEEEQ